MLTPSPAPAADIMRTGPTRYNNPRPKGVPPVQDCLLAMMIAARHQRYAVPAELVAAHCRCTINAVHQAARRLRARGFKIRTSRGGVPTRLWYALEDPTDPRHR